MASNLPIFAGAILMVCFFGSPAKGQYFGKFLGKLSELHHGVSGEVYAVDGRTLHIKDFTYDGQGPAAYFYASTYKAADSRGFRLRDENNNGDVIRRYRKEGVTLTLPEGKTLNNIKIFYVWCEEFDVNFGDVKIPRSFDYPRPQKIAPLKGVHAISSDNIVIVDAQTLLIPNLSYDGEAPDAKFWVGRGPKPSPQGVRVADENGKELPLRRYDRKTVVLTLPGDLTVFDIGHFGIWCEQFTVDFGHIQVPQNLNVPPSLKMLGVSPQKRHQIYSQQPEQVSRVTKARIGGHLQATTYRPPTFLGFAQRRLDTAVPQNQLATQQQYVPIQQQQQQLLYEQQQQLYRQQQQFNQPIQRIDQQQPILNQQLYFNNAQQQLAYQPINQNQRQYQEQLLYNQLIEKRRLEEQQQLAEQLAKYRNRFDLSANVNQQSKLNCEVLNDNLAFEVRWAVAGESIVLQLVAKLDAREYMSFGLSGDDSRSVMIGGDVGVAWIDKDTLKGYVDDYYLAAKAQCSGPTGSCPDNRLEENTNNIRLLNAAMVNGYSIVTYQRPLIASDRFDHEIYTNRSQAIIWAIGPLNQRDEVSFHSHYLKKNSFVDFGRPAKWNCPMPESEQLPMRNVQIPLQTRSKIVTQEEIPIPPPPVEQEVTEIRPKQNERRRGGNRGATRQQLTAASQEEDSERSASKPREQQSRTRGGNRGGQRVQNSVVKSTVPPPTPVEKRNAWKIPPIQCYEPEDGVFYAQMGPTGGKRGYPAITGHVGWGISWYINGLLIPEINVVRGKTYTFVVEGGTDPEISAKYHPFYITDDPVGGYEYKTAQEKERVRIFAGVASTKDGSVQPVGTGRLCHWTQTGDLEADDFESFGAYQRTLELKCDQGEPGVIQWTPDKDTPDTVYYQCFTHRYLGWKINVHDSCDQSPAASEVKTTSLEVPEDFQDFADKSDIELDESPSIQVETRFQNTAPILTK